MKTQDEARGEFSDLYEDMRAENAKDGGSFSKRTLWEQFIAHGIENERFPADATGWTMPRTTRRR